MMRKLYSMCVALRWVMFGTIGLFGGMREDLFSSFLKIAPMLFIEIVWQLTALTKIRQEADTESVGRETQSELCPRPSPNCCGHCGSNCLLTERILGQACVHTLFLKSMDLFRVCPLKNLWILKAPLWTYRTRSHTHLVALIRNAAAVALCMEEGEIFCCWFFGRGTQATGQMPSSSTDVWGKKQRTPKTTSMSFPRLSGHRLALPDICLIFVQQRVGGEANRPLIWKETIARTWKSKISFWKITSGWHMTLIRRTK